MITALKGDTIHLRPERNRALIYKTLPHNSSMEKFAFLHPSVAIFLALLDGEKSLLQVAEELEFVAELPNTESAEVFIEKSMKSIKDALGDDTFIEVNETNKHLVKKLNPLSFVVKKEEINLQGSRLSTPLNINFIVTQECNRNCIYCYAEREQAPHFVSIPLIRVKELLDEAKDLKVHDVTYTGGEPFLRRDLIDIIKYTIDSGIVPIVSTKQYLTVKTCKKLKDVGLNSIQVSLDSADEEVADYLIGSKGFLKQVSHTIKNLIVEQVNVNVHVVVTPYNTFSIPKLLDRLAEWNVQQINLVQYGRSAFRHRDTLFLDTDAIKWLEEKIEDFKTKNPTLPTFHNFSSKVIELNREEKKKIFWERAFCSVGRTSITILPDGKVLTCEQLPTQDQYIVGDLITQSIMEVWNSERLWNKVVPKKDLFEGQPCFNCERFMECHTLKGRCIRDAVNAFGNPYAPDPRCPNAPKAPRLI